MVLRIVHAAVPKQKQTDYYTFINRTLAPAIRTFPGCRFVYVGSCVEQGHEGEVIYVSGWDTLADCEALEATDLYQGAASTVRTFYTEPYSAGAPHLHYEVFAARP
jgi:heme-degrading monooxygenase HmoA